MANVSVYNMEGKEVGTIDLNRYISHLYGPPFALN